MKVIVTTKDPDAHMAFESQPRPAGITEEEWASVTKKREERVRDVLWER